MSGKSSVSVPWVEKHRPRELKDVVGNEDTIEMLQHFALKGNMPNVLLCGTPGQFGFLLIVFNKEIKFGSGNTLPLQLFIELGWALYQMRKQS